MPTITIPRDVAYEEDFVALPRREYDALRKARVSAEFTPTAAQKRALADAEANLRRGATLSYHALVRKLGIAD